MSGRCPIIVLSTLAFLAACQSQIGRHQSCPPTVSELEIYAAFLNQWWNVQRKIIDAWRESDFDQTGLGGEPAWIDMRQSDDSPVVMHWSVGGCDPPQSLLSLTSDSRIDIRRGSKWRQGRDVHFSLGKPNYASVTRVMVWYTEYSAPLASESFLTTFELIEGSWQLADVELGPIS